MKNTVLSNLNAAAMVMPYRTAIEDFIHHSALPMDKYSHQPRVYQLAVRIAEDAAYDDDVLHAAAWLHDIGVFIGHRPEDQAALASWDNVAYAIERVPALLSQFGFPEEKIPAVVNAIHHHLPRSSPQTIEGILLRDADILETLGAIGILRMVSKVGRDTRYPTHAKAIDVLRNNCENLAQSIHLISARHLATPRIKLMHSFLDALEIERDGADI